MSDQDPENATKAPESDAIQEPSVISQFDTKAQTGASMDEHCTSDRLTPSGQQPSGEMTKFSDIDVYISKPADYPNTPGKLLLLLTGGTGVHSVNNQLQADLWATEGFVVIMPDQFAGDPAPNTKAAEEPDSNPSIIEQVKMRVGETAKSFMIDMWLARQTSEKVLPRIHKVIEAARDEYADAVASGGGIYAVGYCFGAKYVVILSGEHPDTVMAGQAVKDEEAGMVSKGPLIKAGAIAHATLVTREDLKAIQAPLTMACVENDPLFPEEVLDVGRKHLGTSSIEHEITMYSGVPHGFAVVGEYESSTIKDAQCKAFQQMLHWLKTH